VATGRDHVECHGLDWRAGLLLLCGPWVHRIVPFRMEGVAADIEGIHLGIADLDALLVGALVAARCRKSLAAAAASSPLPIAHKPRSGTPRGKAEPAAAEIRSVL
jgi:hypothetical protein